MSNPQYVPVEEAAMPDKPSRDSAAPAPRGMRPSPKGEARHGAHRGSSGNAEARHYLDDLSSAPLNTNSNYQPSHAIAFRMVDLTDPNNNSVPFLGGGNGNNVSYGGGKLGIYGYWNTCNATAPPIKPVNNANAKNQYEFYNYSIHPAEGTLPANPSEVGNQYFLGTGNNNYTDEARFYWDDFFNNGFVYGINVETELYTLNSGSAGSDTPTAQVQVAISNAFDNYIMYLRLSSQLNLSSTPAGNMCSMNESCPNCSGDTTCTYPPTYQP
jgi:hypothetical protein